MPQDIRVSPDGKLFYVADMLADGVFLVDGDAFKQVGFIPTGIGTHGLYPSRDGTKLYVSNRGSHTVRRPKPHGPGSVSVIDFATKEVVANWPIPGGGSPDMGNVSADGNVLWLSGRYDDVVYAPSPGPRRARGPGVCRTWAAKPGSNKCALRMEWCGRSRGRANGVERFQPAEVVILAANGVGTPRLLLNSASSGLPHGLSNSSGLVGKNLMLHPWPVVFRPCRRRSRWRPGAADGVMWSNPPTSPSARELSGRATRSCCPSPQRRAPIQ